MAKQKLYQAEGIVLGRRNYDEADRVIILLTAAGRLDLLAKGIRKPHSRKAGHLELFSQSKVLISRVKNFWDIISQAELVKTRPSLQEEFKRGTYARYMGELALRFFEQEANPLLYTLVENALDLLAEAAQPERVIYWYEQRLLELAGFRPEWQHCVGIKAGQQCQAALHPRPDDQRPYGITPDGGGALCPACFAAGSERQTASALSPSALSWLQAFQERAYPELIEFEFPSQTATELQRVMERYISYHLEWQPKTLRMLKSKLPPV